MNTPPLHNADASIDELFNMAINAKQVAVATVARETDMWLENSEIAEQANILLERYRAEFRDSILSLLAEARLDEWQMIAEEVEINKPRSKYVRNVYLPISYIQKRITALRQKESKDERSIT